MKERLTDIKRSVSSEREMVFNISRPERISYFLENDVKENGERFFHELDISESFSIVDTRCKKL
jgi:hypothetical protein